MAWHVWILPSIIWKLLRHFWPLLSFASDQFAWSLTNLVSEGDQSRKDRRCGLNKKHFFKGSRLYYHCFCPTGTSIHQMTWLYCRQDEAQNVHNYCLIYRLFNGTETPATKLAFTNLIMPPFLAMGGNCWSGTTRWFNGRHQTAHCPMIIPKIAAFCPILPLLSMWNVKKPLYWPS